MQIQAELGEGHVNIIEAKEIILTNRHLCLVMEYAAGNSLTGEGPLGQHVCQWLLSRRAGCMLEVAQIPRDNAEDKFQGSLTPSTQ